MKAEIDKNVEIMDLLDLVKFGNFTLKEIVKLIIIVIIVCGGFAIVTSLIGGIGAFFALRVLLIVVSLSLFCGKFLICHGKFAIIPWNVFLLFPFYKFLIYHGKFAIIAW